MDIDDTQRDDGASVRRSLNHMAGKSNTRSIVRRNWIYNRIRYRQRFGHYG